MPRAGRTPAVGTAGAGHPPPAGAGAGTGTTARPPRAAAAAPVRRRPSPGQPWRCSGPTPRICPCPRPTCRPRRRRAGADRSPRNGAPPSSSPPTDDGDVDDDGGRRRRMRRWARRRRVSSRARAARRVYAPAFADGWGRGAVGQRERARGPDEGDGEGRRRRAFGRRNRRSAVGIFPSPAFPLLSKGPTARDDGGVATPTARTGNGSARRAYAPARRISRASGAGT